MEKPPWTNQYFVNTILGKKRSKVLPTPAKGAWTPYLQAASGILKSKLSEELNIIEYCKHLVTNNQELLEFELTLCLKVSI